MTKQNSMEEKMDGVSRYLTNKEIIHDILTTHGIVTGEEIASLDVYERGDDRIGVIVNIKGKSKKSKVKIIIDVKLGEPCIDQVYDAIYEIGKDCDKRLIMFNGEKNETDDENPGAYEPVVSSLIPNMNAYPLGLSLMKFKDQFEIEKVDLDAYETSESANTYSVGDLPSKEKFREAEFWLVYFDSFLQAFYKPWEAFSSGIEKTSEYGQWWDINGLECHTAWNGEGSFFTVRGGDSDNDYVTAVWELKKNQLKERYPGRKVELENLPGKLPRIHIGCWDLPLSWLLMASTEEKSAHAELLLKEHLGLMEFMEYALDEVKARNRQPQDIPVQEKTSEDRGAFEGVHN
jgi:hypothetical protein